MSGVNADVRLSFSPIAEEESGAEEEEENEIMDLGNLPPKKQEAESGLFHTSGFVVT